MAILGINQIINQNIQEKNTPNKTYISVNLSQWVIWMLPQIVRMQYNKNFKLLAHIINFGH